MEDYKVDILFHKRYFDLGYGITSYLKLIIALFGLSSLNVKLTMIFAVVYGVFCYVFGRFWIKYGWYERDIEITNKYDYFVREMRSDRKV